MANEREIKGFGGFKGGGLKAPTSNRGGNIQNTLQALIARDLLKQEAEKRKPELIAKNELAMETAKAQRPRDILIGNMQRMKQLADEVPAGKPGFDRFKVGGQALFKGFTQELPQLNTYNSFKDVILGSVVQTVGSETSSRLSDQDINRMKGAFPRLPFDSDKQRALAWSTFYDTVNDVAKAYGAEPIDPTQFFNENDVSLLKETSGSSYYSGDDVKARTNRLRERYLRGK